MASEPRAHRLRTAFVIAALIVIVIGVAYLSGLLVIGGHNVEVDNRSGQPISWLDVSYPGGKVRFANVSAGRSSQSSFTRQTGWGTIGVVGELADGVKVNGHIGIFLFPNASRVELKLTVEPDGSVINRTVDK